MKKFLLLVCVLFCSLLGKNILSAQSCDLFKFPTGYIEEKKYICGDGFLGHFKNVIVGYSNRAVTQANCSFSPESVQDGDVVFVNTPYLDYFFNAIHPHIANNYILVSHGGDDSVPGKNARFLEDSKMIKWFAVNVAGSHSKLVHIPLGLANSAWEHGNKKIVDEVRSLVESGAIKKDKLLYMNFNAGTNVSLRSAVYAIFAQKSFCTKATGKSFRDYFYELARFKFIVSPHGNGLDCHRTWEAMLIGCIPVVKTSSLDALYKDLPVLIVQDWSEVTEEFLNEKYDEISNRRHNKCKLFLDYWLEKITYRQAAYLSNKKLGIGSTTDDLKRKSAVSYILNGGRLGDNILNYLHAKWLAYSHKLPLLYVPFEYSDQLLLDESEPLYYEDYRRVYATQKTILKATDPFGIDHEAHHLYKIGYFPEKSVSYYDQLYFQVSWDDPGFKDEIRRLIKPRYPLNLITPPEDKPAIAVHVRTGGGYDTDKNWVRYTPGKFLTDTFYINAIKKIVDELDQEPVYIFIFTDHEHPETILSKFKAVLSHYGNIEWDCRREGNKHNSNVLEDLFSMINFDYLIRSESNLPTIASKLGYFKMVIEPRDIKNTVIGSPNEPHSFYTPR